MFHFLQEQILRDMRLSLKSRKGLMGLKRPKSRESLGDLDVDLS